MIEKEDKDNPFILILVKEIKQNSTRWSAFLRHTQQLYILYVSDVSDASTPTWQISIQSAADKPGIICFTESSLPQDGPDSSL